MHIIEFPQEATIDGSSSPDHDALVVPGAAAVDLVEAEHLCMTLRGANARGSRTITSALRGLVREDARTREEFLALARPSQGCG